MANRQRKVQSAQVWTWRVANTTTTQAVYRIPVNGNRECDVRSYETIGISPIKVTTEWSNIYRVSLDTEALKTIIEAMPLDMSNVELTLGTVDGNVHFTGSVDVDGIFTWTSINATDIDTNSLNSASISTVDITATNASIAKLNATEIEANTANITEATINNETVITSKVTSLLATKAEITEDLLVEWTETVNGKLTANGWAEVKEWLNVAWGTITDSLEVAENAVVKWNLEVNWTSKLDWKVTTWDDIEVTWNATIRWNEIINWTETVNWATTLNSTLAVAWVSTFNWNVNANKNLTVAWDETVSGNVVINWNETVNGKTTFNWEVVAEDDVTAKRNLTVNNKLNVKWLTTLEWAVEAKDTLKVDGTAMLGSNVTVGENLTVAEQVSSKTIRTDEIVTDEIRVNTALNLSEWAIAPDFVLQAEKWAPNGVAELDENGRMPVDQLPEIYTTAIVKIGGWIFNNSDTCIIEDSTITADSYVNISNYTDIIGDVNEIIHPGQITLVSNQVETGSFKYIVVNPLN